MIALPVFTKHVIIRPAGRIIFFVLFLLTSPNLQAQTYYFDNYGVEDGLSSSKVYNIIQDHNDFVWLGTEAGLSMFDGVVFRNYTSEDGLAEGGVLSVFQDSKNRIWLGHLDGGVSLYRRSDFQFIGLPAEGRIGDITSIIEDKAGQIWFTTTAQGVFRIDNPDDETDQFEFTHLRGRDGLSDQVFFASRLQNDDLYFLTDVGVRIFIPDSARFEPLELESLTQYFMKITMFQDSKGDLWFGTYNGGLYHYSTATGEMIIYDSMRDGLAKNWVSFITEDMHGRMWIGTWGGGISIIDGDEIKNYNMDNGLNDNNVRCIVEDAEGNMLIGTFDHGLNIFKGEQFVTIDVDDGLSNPIVWAIHQDSDGNFWFGTNGGITRYDPRPGAPEPYTYYNQENRNIENKIRFFREDRNGDIWIGTEGGWVIRYEKSSGRFISDPALNEYLYADRIITALEIDAHNNLWIGTNEGLGYWEIDTRYVERLTQINGLAGNAISALYYDSRGVLWIGSQVRGLTKCVKMGDEYEFTVYPVEKNFTPNSITQDRDGNLWIGTPKGLYVFNGDSVTGKFTERDGLLTRTINLVDTDGNGNIYIGTNKGLNKYVPVEDKLYTYTRKNGFVGIETKRNASFLDQDGNIWFGTVNGVTRYNPMLVRTDVPEPLTHIREMLVNYQPMEMGEELQLNFRQKNIIFDYNSICLTNPEAVLYQVMLEGADEDWRPVTTQTRAIYPSLSPKHYRFMVKARNSDGIWNEEPIEYSFVIKPPFYRSWWFIIVCILAGGTGILSYIKVREQQLVRKNRILEEKVVIRTAEVVQKSEELAQKNKDITDSIKYAQRIQHAILPPEDAFTETFVLFKPKDIVSGDFYWLDSLDDKHLIAAVDCTGHGVPGAFMSIIGHNSLNKIVKEYNIYEPAEILEKLNEEVVKTLQQQSEDGEVKDGMDLALISLDFKARELDYAGAYNPLYIISRGELTEVKADRFAIGRSSVITERKFTNHHLKLKKDDMIYIFSDGYADQFGGPDGKKFKYKTLKNLLVSISDLPLQEQEKRLDSRLAEWMGNHEQVDDILIIGSRVK